MILETQNQVLMPTTMIGREIIWLVLCDHVYI